MKITFYWPAVNWRECLAILISHLWDHLEHRPGITGESRSNMCLHALKPGEWDPYTACLQHSSGMSCSVPLVGLVPNAHKTPLRDFKQSSIRKVKLFGLEMLEGNTSVVFSLCFSSSLLLTKFSCKLQILLERPSLYLSQNKPFIRKGHPPLASGGFLAGRLNWPSGTRSNSFIQEWVRCCRQNKKVPSLSLKTQIQRPAKKGKNTFINYGWL